MRFFAVLIIVLAVAGCQPRATRDHPVVFAVLQNNAAEVTAYLAQAGDPNLKNRDGDALIYLAAGPKGGEAVADLLLKAGANPDGTSHEGRTALENAAGWCDTEMVYLLLAGGARLDMLSNKGADLGAIACQYPADRRAETLSLLQAGAPMGE